MFDCDCDIDCVCVVDGADECEETEEEDRGD